MAQEIKWSSSRRGPQTFLLTLNSLKKAPRDFRQRPELVNRRVIFDERRSRRTSDDFERAFFLPLRRSFIKRRGRLGTYSERLLSHLPSITISLAGEPTGLR